ncbi:MAG: signal peptidase I [Actinobacteria bacterium]|nr:signal peptidase I [Actinomycetota bacterium]
MTDEIAVEPAEASRRRPVRRRHGWVIFLRDIVVILLIAVLVSFLVKSFVVRSFYIPSGSMESTLLVKDRILVDELTPHWNGYHRGDVVVFKDPGGWLPPAPAQPPRPALVEAGEWFLTLVGIAAPDSDDHLVKRLIGLPGDHVVCCNSLGQLTVNGAPVDESAYLKQGVGDTRASGIPFDVTVPKNAIWVLGDNRTRSEDSRYHQDQPGGGFVPMGNIVGRAFLITWPFDRFGLVDGHYAVFNGVPEPKPQGRRRGGRRA